MIPAIVNSQLAAQPADVTVPTATGGEPGVWLEVANLSPYAFELIDDGNQIRGMVGPFRYLAILISSNITDRIVLHALGTQAVAFQPFTNTSWKVDAGLTKHPSMTGTLT
jgi:hypothetical protein